MTSLSVPIKEQDRRVSLGYTANFDIYIPFEKDNIDRVMKFVTEARTFGISAVTCNIVMNKGNLFQIPDEDKEPLFQDMIKRFDRAGYKAEIIYRYSPDYQEEFHKYAIIKISKKISKNPLTRR